MDGQTDRRIDIRMDGLIGRQIGGKRRNTFCLWKKKSFCKTCRFLMLEEITFALLDTDNCAPAGPGFKRMKFAANSIYCSPFSWAPENEHSFLFANNRSLATVRQLFIVTICAVIVLQLHSLSFVRFCAFFPSLHKLKCYIYLKVVNTVSSGDAVWR